MTQTSQSPAPIAEPVIFEPGPRITITENAANKVWELIQEEANLNLKLRVFITGGGCSGFQYGFTFDEAMNDDDTVISKTAM